MSLTLATLLDARVDRAAAARLDERTARDLGWSAIQAALAERCAGDAGIDLAEHLGPQPGRDEALALRSAVVALAAVLATDEAPPLRGYRDARPTAVRATKGDVLTPDLLFALRQTLEVAGRVRAWAFSRRERAPDVADLAEQIDPLDDLVRELRLTFDVGGEVSDAASPELARLRRRAAGLRQGILDRLEKILRSPRFEGILQDEYVTIRDERYVVPIRSGERGDFPGIVHGQSGSGQTLFIEPQELVGANNELRLAQMEVENEIRRILAALSRRVERHAGAIALDVDLLVSIDVVTAAARLSNDLACAAPRLHPVRPGARLQLLGARHPILALRAFAGELEVVPNDIELPVGAHALVVSGPNTGGKTVTLKTLGLFALMSQAGLPVPTSPDSEMPFWERVFSDIGDEQAVERDLSTFSGHVRNLVRLLPDCDARTLLVLDELFAGTDPGQGAALGRALLEELAGRNTWVVVTTHLEQLKTLAYEDSRFAAASVGFDIERLGPTYRLRMGVPGSSYAFRIAQRLGLPARIVQRAEQSAGDARDAVRDALIERIERESVQLAAARAEADRQRAAAAEERERLAKRIADLQRRDREALDDDVRALRTRVAAAASALDEVQKALRRGDAAPDAAATIERAREVAREVEPAARAVRTPGGSAPARFDDLRVGSDVFVVPFGKPGVVAEAPKAGERVVVQVGPMRASFAITDLRTVVAETRAPAAGRVQFERAREREAPSRTLDLRGSTVDDALERLDAFLDAGAQDSAWSALVIHGHGTGALKRAVRARLQQSPWEIRFRPGQREEGGDGVTVVEFGAAPAPEPG